MKINRVSLSVGIAAALAVLLVSALAWIRWENTTEIKGIVFPRGTEVVTTSEKNVVDRDEFTVTCLCRLSGEEIIRHFDETLAKDGWARVDDAGGPIRYKRDRDAMRLFFGKNRKGKEQFTVHVKLAADGQ